MEREKKSFHFVTSVVSFSYIVDIPSSKKKEHNQAKEAPAHTGEISQNVGQNLEIKTTLYELL